MSIGSFEQQIVDKIKADYQRLSAAAKTAVHNEVAKDMAWAQQHVWAWTGIVAGGTVALTLAVTFWL